MLNIRMSVVLLFASFGMAEHCVVLAQKISPIELTKAEQATAHSASFTSLPEDPSVSKFSDGASGSADFTGDSESKAKAAASQYPPISRHFVPEREIALEGFVSYGNWQIFAAGEEESLYTAGVEYDRNSWGNFAGAQMDYVAEVLPFVLLKQPRVLDPWGHRMSKDNVLVPGLGFSPIGLRMLWRPEKTFKPYFNVKGGAVAFTQKALSPDASYYAFSLSESIGFYVKMSDRWDMRVGLFGDYHFSNAYITSYNPGLDVMNSSIAFSYHLGGAGAPR